MGQENLALLKNWNILMVFHCSTYRMGKADLIKHLRRFNNDVSLLSYYCAAGAFPVAAAIVFCIEEFPEHRELLEKKLEAVKEFYGYESIEE